MRAAEVWRCLNSEWRIKFLLGGLVTIAFWVGYFWLEHVHLFPETKMPVCAIDRMVPFRPEAAALYISQFLLVPLVLWLTASRRQLLLCGQGLALMIGVAFASFLIFPTLVVRPATPSGANYIYDLVARCDLPCNACPSLHAAFGVFIGAYSCDVFRPWRMGSLLIGAVWLWAAAILFSTLLIKQHVALDLAAGGVLGLVSWMFALSRRPGQEALT